MQSFIISAKEKKNREEYEKKHAAQKRIDPFDITIIQKDETIKSQSIGIEIVKQIHKKVFLKPIKSSRKLIIIEDAQFLTPEAQNALLKILEEPPASTHIILGTENLEALLPTILSRCQIIILEEEQKKISMKTMDELNIFIQTLPELTIGARLKQAEILAKDKEKAIVWIENLILIIREKLLENVISGNNAIAEIDSGSSKRTTTFIDSHVRITIPNYTRALKSLHKLHTILKSTNVNPRFAIEHTLLSI